MSRKPPAIIGLLACLLVAASGGSTALSQEPVVIGPYLQLTTTESVVIVWETCSKTTGAVEYGRDERYGKIVRGAGEARRHEIGIEGLAPGTSYHYRIMVNGKPPKDNRSRKARRSPTFTTAPAHDQPFSFAVLGDTRSDHAKHAMVAAAVLQGDPAFVVHTGDFVSRGGSRSDWSNFFQIEADLLRDCPLFPVLGNHDKPFLFAPTRYLEIFVLPRNSPDPERVYSFDWGNCHFVVLDTEQDMDWQKTWLEKDLGAARGRPEIRHIFAALHRPPYSTGSHGSYRPALVYVVPVLRRFKVDYLFAGHDHVYERGEVEGLKYIVSGGGGASLYPRRCSAECPSWSKAFRSVHHYIHVSVNGDVYTVCPRLTDGSVIEECLTYGRPSVKSPK